ncbi:MAG: outer membrane beta-barrel protein [Aureispira sp.]
MKCLFVLVIVAYCSCAILAQEGLKLSAYITPSICFSFNKEDAQKGTTLQQQLSFGYTTGLLLGYGITDIVSVSTGVAYYEHRVEFEHQRAILANDNTDPNFGATALRRSQYIRVPLMVGLASDPNRKWGVLARFGPHFNFLLQANYYDSRLEGYSNYNTQQGIDLTQQISLYQENSNGGLIKQGGTARVYQVFVPGITAEVGVQFRVNDQMKLTALVHVEGSSNPEAAGAASLAHNLNRGDYLVASNPFDAPVLAQADNNKQQTEETPFDAVFPNYTDNNVPNATSRASTWQMMLGLQLGIVYTHKND